MKVPSNVAGKFTPAGKLRVSINSAILFLQGGIREAIPCRVSIDLADNFAKRLGVEIEFVL